MTTDPDSADVKAAGGLVRRDGRVAVAHRPRYDDWSFPKGKLDPGETWEQAALREVEEGHKIVRYWLMEPESGEFTPNEEVDEVRWLSPAEAERLLTYGHDRELVREAGA